uniref:Putative leucine-rich repeat domain, L domain-like protein n=1 Tax=Helianthus annuus TaxID=4232 RepID=A0A251VD85_HELAN
MKAFGDLQLPNLISWSIWECKNLESFPDLQLSNLTMLKDLRIRKCPMVDASFPRGLWPPNLCLLRIGGLKKPISEWGNQNFPASLVELYLYDEPDVMNFSQLSHLFPSSLTFLEINNFDNLESLSTGLQHLTSLQHLLIDDCPKVNDLPETLNVFRKRLPLLATHLSYPLDRHNRLIERKRFPAANTQSLGENDIVPPSSHPIGFLNPSQPTDIPCIYMDGRVLEHILKDDGTFTVDQVKFKNREKSQVGFNIQSEGLKKLSNIGPEANLKERVKVLDDGQDHFCRCPKVNDLPEILLPSLLSWKDGSRFCTTNLNNNRDM